MVQAGKGTQKGVKYAITHGHIHIHIHTRTHRKNGNAKHERKTHITTRITHIQEVTNDAISRTKDLPHISCHVTQHIYYPGVTHYKCLGVISLLSTGTTGNNTKLRIQTHIVHAEKGTQERVTHTKTHRHIHTHTHTRTNTHIRQHTHKHTYAEGWERKNIQQRHMQTHAQT